MRLITKFELAAKTDAELYGLYRDIFNSLTEACPERPERKNATATLQFIQNEIVMRTTCKF